MKTIIEFEQDENAKANMCVNIERIIRVLEEVQYYAEYSKDEALKIIIEDYLNLKEE